VVANPAKHARERVAFPNEFVRVSYPVVSDQERLAPRVDVGRAVAYAPGQTLGPMEVVDGGVVRPRSGAQQRDLISPDSATQSERTSPAWADLELLGRVAHGHGLSTRDAGGDGDAGQQRPRFGDEAAESRGVLIGNRFRRGDLSAF
jgi:hypothetical protein